MAKQYLVARDTDGKVVGVRVTPRTYTHAIIGQEGKGEVGVLPWCGRLDLADKAIASLAKGRTVYTRLAKVQVSVGTHADLAAWRPTYSQVVVYAHGRSEARTSVYGMDHVDVVDVVPVADAVSTDVVPYAGWKPFAFVPGTREEQMAAYVAREIESRQTLRAKTMALPVNPDGTRTVWGGWSTWSGQFADQVAATYAPCGLRATVRRVPVTQVVVG